MNLQERVTRIIKQPKTEWPVIEAEPTDIATLYKSYIAPLAAIPAIAGLIGYVVVGISLPFVGRYRLGVGEALRMQIFQYIGSLLGCFVAAIVVSKLASTFQSREDNVQALKLVAYSTTPMWIAGILYLIPALSPLVILAGLYAIYLYYLGVPVLMKTPQDKVIPYMVVSVLVIIVVMFVVSLIVGFAGGGAAMMGRGV